MSAITTEASLYQTLGLARELEHNNRNNELQLEDFLNLMVTELTHQDPFKPMDNSELASQISQFATVSGIDQLNESFAGLSGSLVSDQSLQAANLVGRQVLVPTNSGYLENGGSIDGIVGLDSRASEVTVGIYSATGALLREINLGTQPKGEVNFSWDGLMDNGDYAPPGKYQLSAEATIDGDPIAPYLLTQASVNSVSIGAPGQGLALNLKGLGAISFNDVAEIR